MKRITTLFTPSLLLLAIACGGVQAANKKPSRVIDADWSAVADYQVPAWFVDAKFGIYAHWGPASQGTYGSFDDWYAGCMYNQECRKGRSNNYHKEAFGDPKEFGYKEVIKKFDPSGFDAENLAALYAQSGAKFAGPVAIHHDNFAMWDSKISRWNSVNYGGIDVSGELKKALETRDLKFMMSSHLAFSWDFFRGSYDYDGADPQYRDLYHTPHKGKINVRPGRSNGDKPDQAFNDMWLAKMKEMIDDYNPDLIWHDFGPEMLQDNILHNYVNYYYEQGEKKEQPVVITFKHGAKAKVPAHLAVHDHERSRPHEVVKDFWLTDTSLGPWYYEKGFEQEALDNSELIKMLVDIVSKNGSILFNVPLKRDGSVPSNTRKLLEVTGAWLAISGEAIYGTRPWTRFGEGPHEFYKDEKGRLKKADMYTDADIRFTTKGKALYAISLGQPKGKITITSLKSEIGKVSKVTMLGLSNTLNFTQDDKGLHIEVPKTIPSVHANTFKVEGLL